MKRLTGYIVGCVVAVAALPAIAAEGGPGFPVPAFIQQAKLIGSNSGGLRLGYAVGLSQDGNTALTIGPGLHDEPFGAAWMFKRNAVLNKWNEQARFPVYGAIDAALSGAGNTAVVASAYGNGTLGSTGFVFQRSFGQWSAQATLSPPLAGRGEASAAVSGDGNTVLIGSAEANGGVGAAFVFTRRAGTWSQQAELIGTDVIGGGASQGSSAALSADGNTAVIGGERDDADESGNGATGATWIFTRVRGQWRQVAKLVGSDAIGKALQGSAVAVSADGNTVLIGGPLDNSDIGAAWVFTRSYGTWSQQAKLIGSNVIGPFAFQGNAVALSDDGNTAVVGGPSDNSQTIFPYLGQGAAWVFHRDHGVWKEIQKLVGTGGIGEPEQGFSVAISGDGRTILSGAPWDVTGGGGIPEGNGAIWVFEQRLQGEPGAPAVLAAQ